MTHLLFRRLAGSGLLAIIMLLAFAAHARGQCVLHETAKLIAPDGATDDHLGLAAAIFGDTFIAGSYGDDDAGSDSGSAHVFVRTMGPGGPEWTLQQKLNASDADVSDNFGRAVAIRGDTALVAAEGNFDMGSFSGSVYVFVRESGVWTQQQNLTASDGTAGDLFGRSVAISGNALIVVALGDDDLGGSSGSGYVFVYSAGIWSQQQKLTASDGENGDFLGVSAGIDGDTVVLGAYGSGTGGAAYVFVRSSGVWSQEQKLVGSDTDVDDEFGRTVAISGDTIIVGSERDDDAGGNSGSAHVFVRSSGIWTEQQKLTASDASAGDQFGTSVSLAGDMAVVGSKFRDGPGANAGSAYVFVRSGGIWTQKLLLAASDAVANDNLGHAVSIFDNKVVLGAPNDDELSGPDAGSAYVFEIDLSDSDEDGAADICDNCSAIPNAGQADQDSDGIGDACDNCLNTPNVGQEDQDSDGVGDACDNCVADFNPAQENRDGDAAGDECDLTDDDGDFNGDGKVDGDDIKGFDSCYFSQSALGACAAADMDDDGDIDQEDIALFIAELLAK